MTAVPAAATARGSSRLPPGVDFARALVAGLDARLAGQPPEAVARVEIWVNTRRAAAGARRASSPTGRRGSCRASASSPSSPTTRSARDLPPPVPALRRKLELARLVAALADGRAASLAAGTAAFDLADSLAELLDEMQGEGVARRRLRRASTPAEHAAHWQRSLRFLTLIADYLAAAGPADGPGPAARRRRGAGRAPGRSRRRAHPVIVAGSTGSRGADPRLHGRGRAAAAGRAGAARASTPALPAGGLGPPRRRRPRRRRPPAARLPPRSPTRSASIPARCRPGTRPRRRARRATRSSRWRCAPRRSPTSGGAKARALAGRLAAACAGLDLGRGARPARRGAGDRARACARRPRPAPAPRSSPPTATLARRVTAELDRWGAHPRRQRRPAAGADPARRPAAPARRAARRAR